MAKFWEWIKDAAVVICHPGVWMPLNNRYSEEWDRELCAAIRDGQRFEWLRLPLLGKSDNTKGSYTSSFTTRLGPYVIWVENHPYASMTTHTEGEYVVRPKRATVIRTHAIAMKHLREAELKDNPKTWAIKRREV